jgi:aspartyl-tRNA(Asn)/glutamyl-tRNA(Gln) amidotransferase subunit C
MIGEDEVRKIAGLARLELSPDFIPVITGHLNSILGYVQRLNDVDTTGVEPMSHVNGATNVLREDVVREVGTSAEPVPLGDPTIPGQDMLPSEALVSNVPESSGRFIRVPLIVE